MAQCNNSHVAVRCEGPIQSSPGSEVERSAEVVGPVGGTAHLGSARTKNLKKIICCDCKEEIEQKAANQKRCAPCAKAWKRKSNKPYARAWIKNSKRTGKNCSRCGKPTGKKGCCEHCREYVRSWKKENPLLVQAIKKKRIGERRTGYLKLVDSLLLKQKGKCALCGAKADKWHLDHKIPVSLGGCSEDFNFQVLCVWCNLHKGAKIIDPKEQKHQLRLVA